MATLLLMQAGCESGSTPDPARTVDNSPQAKFNRVVAALRKGLDTGVESGGGRYTFSDTSGAGSTVFSYTVDAPEKITEPNTPGKLPRTTIKITQSSSYSALTSSKEDEEDREDERSNKRGSDNDALTEETQANLESIGYEVLDPALVNKDIADAAAPRIRAPDYSTRTITTDTVVVYDLVFENNRWRMAAPPSADTPESTNIALDLALKRQN